MKRNMLSAGAIALIVGGWRAVRRTHKTKSETLLKARSSWNNIAYEQYPEGNPELTVVRVTIPPYSSLPWHVHDMPNAAFILAGKLTVEEHGTGLRSVFKKGQAFAESVHSIHRGVTGREGAVAIVTYAGVPGQQLSVKQDV
ncbi:MULTISPECIES: cupin domain-containing protein [Acetobacteraceae]|nr:MULTISPECIES: cupin domain-containing protein [Acetobacteraceae]MCE0743825.1 cupin domain-containing protein [Acetobacter sicerae]MCG0995486.1 cupin domain-containing protein [Acetobacter indonesiensis]MDO8172110.1 cupin domain-containing protein [Acetobacter tropicalis]